MDHTEAASKFAAEQYVLGELDEAEREAFERHFFECSECAEAVEAGTMLALNAQSVFRDSTIAQRPAVVPEKKKWFFAGWRFAPSAALAACAVMAIFVGYQNLVQIPAMRAGGDLDLAPAVTVRAARAAQGLTFSRRTGMMSVTVAHEWEEPYARYQGEIERAADHKILSNAEIAATPGDITISAALRRFEPGSYFLNLYGLREGSSERTAVARVPITLTE